MSKGVAEWGAEGSSFLILDVQRFKEILPMYFKTSKLSSFVRQLNMYNFHKQKNVCGYQEFIHPLFKRSAVNELKSIKRKVSVNYKSNKHKTSVQVTEDRPAGSLKAELEWIQRRLGITRRQKRQLLKRTNKRISKLKSKNKVLTTKISRLLLLIFKHFLDHDSSSCFTQNASCSINDELAFKLSESFDFQSPIIPSRIYSLNGEDRFHDMFSEMIDPCFNHACGPKTEATGINEANAFTKTSLGTTGSILEYRELESCRSTVSLQAVDNLECSSLNMDYFHNEASPPSELVLLQQALCLKSPELEDEDDKRHLCEVLSHEGQLTVDIT